MVRGIIILISISFLIGAISVAVINRRKPADARDRWVKYVTYFLLVYAMLWIMLLGEWYFQALAVIIAGLGYYELFITGLRKGNMMLLANGVIVYTVLLAGFAAFVLKAPPEGLVMIYFVVILFDGFSQLCGQLFGKRKLAPVTSPNKTIEGFIGGWMITLLCSFHVFFGLMAWDIHLLVFWVLACPVALMGDLAASWYKRRVGVKDYSDLIPGHGGVLDRFDSFIAVCAFYFLINFIL